VFPFSNDVVRFGATGSELIGLVIKNAGSELSRKHPVMQLSGVVAKWEERSGAPSLIEVTVGGEPIDPDRVYTVSTNSYVADRWRYNLGFEPSGSVAVGKTVFEAALEKARLQPIAPPTDPRMVRAR
jgi:2',3'-cyclic-nucleotide 2'-phosphodiesterase (5'-nucleotidase family)